MSLLSWIAQKWMTEGAKKNGTETHLDSSGGLIVTYHTGCCNLRDPLETWTRGSRDGRH